MATNDMAQRLRQIAESVDYHNRMEDEGNQKLKDVQATKVDDHQLDLEMQRRRSNPFAAALIREYDTYCAKEQRKEEEAKARRLKRRWPRLRRR
jgi:hypothetical protein